MATISTPENRILDLNPQATTQLVFKPMIVSHNVITPDLPLYEVVEADHKVSMTHLEVQDDFLQPKTNCATWNPTVRFSTRPSEFLITDYEVNGELCPSEFDSGVGRILTDRGTDSLRVTPGGTPELNELEQGMVLMLQNSLQNNVFQNLWFSDLNFGTVDQNWGTSDLTALDPDSRARLTTTISQQNGIWDELLAYEANGQIPYVDSNDGTAANNALLPANITDFFKTMIRAGSAQLRQWMRSRTNPNERPMIFVQPGLFSAYEDYLESLGQEAAYSNIVDGVNPNILRYKGFNIVNMPEWDMFDIKTGRWNPATNESFYQRALLTVPRNITVGVSAKPLAGSPGSGLVIQQSTDIRDKGVKWMYYTLGLGGSFAHENLCVVAYNSSNTYATS